MKKIHHLLFFLFVASVALFLFEKYKVAPARLQTFITSYTDKLQQETIALNSLVEKNIKQQSWNHLFLTREIGKEELKSIGDLHSIIKQVEIFNARGHWLMASDNKSLSDKVNWQKLKKYNQGQTLFSQNKHYRLFPVYQNKNVLLGFISFELKPIVFDKTNIVFLSDAKKNNIVLPENSLSQNGKQQLKNILHDNSFYAENYVTAVIDGISRDIFLHSVKGSIANLGIMFPSSSVFSFTSSYLIAISFLLFVFSIFVYPAVESIQEKRRLKNEKKRKIEKILKTQRQTLDELKTQMKVLQDQKNELALSPKKEIITEPIEIKAEKDEKSKNEFSKQDTEKPDSLKLQDEEVKKNISSEKAKKDLLTDFTFLDPLSMDNFEKEKKEVSRQLFDDTKTSSLENSPTDEKSNKTFSLDTVKEKVEKDFSHKTHEADEAKDISAKDKKDDQPIVLSEKETDKTDKSKNIFPISKATPMQDTVSLLEEEAEENDILSMDVPAEVKKLFEDNARKIKDIKEKISEVTEGKHVEQRLEAKDSLPEKTVQDSFVFDGSLGDFPENVIDAKNSEKEGKYAEIEETILEADANRLEEQSLTDVAAEKKEHEEIREEIIMFDDSDNSEEGIIMFDDSETETETETETENENIVEKTTENNIREEITSEEKNISQHDLIATPVPKEALSQKHIDKIRERVFSKENKEIFEKVAANANAENSPQHANEQVAQDTEQQLSEQENIFKQIDSFSENPPTHQWGILFDTLNKLYLNYNITENLNSIFTYFQELLSANGLTYIAYNSLMRCYQSAYQNNLESLEKYPLYILENDPLLVSNGHYRYFPISKKTKEDIYFFKKFPFEILEQLQGIFVISLKQFGVNGFLMATYFKNDKQEMVENFSQHELNLQIEQMIPALKALQTEHTASVSVDNVEKMATEFRLLTAQKNNNVKVLHCFSYGKILPAVFHSIEKNTSSTLQENERVFYLSPDHLVFFLKETPSSSISDVLLKHLPDIKIENYNFPEDGENPYLYL